MPAYCGCGAFSPQGFYASDDHFMDIQDIRLQFAEQLKCLEVRTEVQVSLLSEIQDYFKKRAEIELEYSKNLDRLAKNILARRKADKAKHEQWSQYSLYILWDQLAEDARTQARNHAVVSDLYANQVTFRLASQSEAIQRISKRCREVGGEQQQEILRVLHELHTALKTYQVCHAESCVAETKFQTVDEQKSKFEQQYPKKQGSRKHKFLEKEFDKKQAKYQAFKLKALKARNEYLLCIDAANAALRKYYADDVSDLLDCMDVGLCHWLYATLSVVSDSGQWVVDSRQASLNEMKAWLASLDPRVDKQKFLETNHALFMLPRRFDFKAHKNDEIKQVSAQKCVQEDLIQRYQQLSQRLVQLRTETEEIWKTLETAEKTLMDMAKQPELTVAECFKVESASQARKMSTKESNENGQAQKRKQEMVELEQFYLNKFREYTLTSNLVQRLNARQQAIHHAIGAAGDLHQAGMNGKCAQSPVRDIGSSEHSSSDDLSRSENLALPNRPPTLPPKPKRKRIGRSHGSVQRPRLFGGSLEEYVEATGEEIPLVIRSCIRVLSLHGLHHQGVFRVSGSQIEINAFRESFERGEDPLLATGIDSGDVNSVAGVLKLYFRELREPLFPMYMFDEFVECAKMETREMCVEKIYELVHTLPRCVFVVMRYLFAFLNHLSEFSDENMMDPYNLAICFGPTLIPIPESRDQVFFHNHVNELVKNMIVFHENIFPNDGGIVYEKYLLADKGDEGETQPDSMVMSDEEVISEELAGSEEDLLTISVDGLPCIDNCGRYPGAELDLADPRIKIRRSSASPGPRPASMLAAVQSPPPRIDDSDQVWYRRHESPQPMKVVAPSIPKETRHLSFRNRYYDAMQQSGKGGGSVDYVNHRHSNGTSAPSAAVKQEVLHHVTVEPLKVTVPTTVVHPQQNGDDPSPPKSTNAHSPLALKEIQVELKAVLSSLESFTQQSKMLGSTVVDVPSPAPGATAPVRISPPRGSFTPDLVQDLPKRISGGGGSESSGSDAGSPPTTNLNGSAMHASFADTFAESRESTLKKGVPPFPLEDQTPAAAAAYVGTLERQGEKTRPPVAKKPTAAIQGSPKPVHRLSTKEFTEISKM